MHKYVIAIGVVWVVFAMLLGNVLLFSAQKSKVSTAQRVSRISSEQRVNSEFRRIPDEPKQKSDTVISKVKLETPSTLLAKVTID